MGECSACQKAKNGMCEACIKRFRNMFGPVSPSEPAVEKVKICIGDLVIRCVEDDTIPETEIQFRNSQNEVVGRIITVQAPAPRKPISPLWMFP